MTREVRLDDVRRMVAVQLGAGDVGPDDRLMEELGAESADVANLVAALEDRYGVVIDEEEIPELRTVRDLYERARSET